MVDVRAHNRAAWDVLSRAGDRWSVPVDRRTIARARRGEWSIQLTNTKSAPRAWFPADMRGVDVLALAAGGGQQGPVLAATGARVSVLDLSPEQLAQDARVAKREGLELRLVEGAMEDLGAFADASFDLVVNPTSAHFTRDIRQVWRECARVLRPGGALLAGFMLPVAFLFGREEEAPLVARHAIPYADETQLPPDALAARVGRREPLEFGHTLDDLVGGQLAAGLALVDMYEDVFDDAPLDRHLPGMMATRALRRG